MTVPGQDRNRRARPAQADAQHGGVVQGEGFGQAGHESLPGRLVPPVAQRFAKVSKPAGVEGADQKDAPAEG